MQKRFVVCAAALMLLLAARPAHANFNDARFHRIMMLNTLGACAVVLYAVAVDQNLTNGNEALLFGTRPVSSLARLRAAQALISPGVYILFASAAFAQAAKIKADEEISDADCMDLAAGTEVTFKGSFGNDAAKTTLPSTFGANKAVVEDGSVVDLAMASTSFEGHDGTMYSVGSGSGTGTGGGGGGGGGGTGTGGGMMNMGGGGCSAVAGLPDPAGALPLVLLALAALRRRR